MEVEVVVKTSDYYTQTDRPMHEDDIIVYVKKDQLKGPIMASRKQHSSCQSTTPR
jgi:hypothetical protein